MSYNKYVHILYYTNIKTVAHVVEKVLGYGAFRIRIQTINKDIGLVYQVMIEGALSKDEVLSITNLSNI